MKLLFIGDSITEGFNTDRYLDSYLTTNIGVSGDSTLECIERIESFNSKETYDYVFVCIGTNDLARERTDEFIMEHIKIIINLIQTTISYSNIVLTSLFPTHENLPRPNDRIRNLNEKMNNFASSEKIMFLNLNPFFSDVAGSLKANFTEDGLHLNEDAYSYWANKLKDYINNNL